MEHTRALRVLSLDAHIAGIQAHELDSLTRDEDKALLANPNPQAARLAPYRHNWNTLTHARANEAASREFRAWLLATTHRARTYYKNTLNAVLPQKYPDELPEWLSLNIPLRAHQRLLQRRVMATDLATHIPTSQRGENDYEESFCPLCARNPGPQGESEKRETFNHLIRDCESLQPEQAALTDALQETWSALHPSNSPVAPPPTPWTDVPRKTQRAVLMGQPDVWLAQHFPDPPHIPAVLSYMIRAADPHLTTLFRRRAQLIRERYPELLSREG